MTSPRNPLGFSARMDHLVSTCAQPHRRFAYDTAGCEAVQVDRCPSFTDVDLRSVRKRPGEELTSRLLRASGGAAPGTRR
jgi:hypothetical protein